MALVRRMTANPVRSLVTVTRTKRGKTMATRKRRRSTKRRAVRRTRSRNPVNPVNPVNPARRRRRRSRRSTVYARRRNPINPTRRRRRIGRRRSRRNPVTGVLGRAIPLVIGSAVIGATAPFTAQIVGRFAPQLLGNPIGVAATTFGTGWALSLLAGAFAFTRKWKDDVMLAGAVLAGGQLFTAYVAPMIPRLGGQGGNGMGRRYNRNGMMSGIGVMTGIPPGMALAPPVNNSGMQGIGTMTAIPPGMQR
jgi:hypothetical protein